MKKLLATSSIALALGFAAAPANAFIVDGIEVSPGFTLSIGQIFESQVTQIGDELTGIGRITNISDSNANITWQDGDNGRELTFVFGGFILTSVTPTLTGATLTFSGGYANFYSDSTPDFSINSGLATNLANASDGDLWLSVAAAEAFGPGITLVSSVSSANLASVTNGVGDAFFDVTGGSAASNFDTNGITGGYDFNASFDFDDEPPTGNYPFSGSADFKAAAIAEPVSLGLMGAGLAGLGLLARRRKSA